MTDAELTALWAEKVMGWHSWDDHDSDYEGPLPMFAVWEDHGNLAVYEEYADPSFYCSPLHSIDDAMRGFEAHPEWAPEITREGVPGCKQYWQCQVWNWDTRRFDVVAVSKDSLPRAIVLAQLRACGVEVSNG